MFTGGSVVRPFDVGTVIRWIDKDRGPDCGRIVGIGTTYYSVKNAKQEQRTVNINDHSLRVARMPDVLKPPIGMYLSDLTPHINKLWLTWKAN